MATETGNTAAGSAMLRPDSRDTYAAANLMLYRTSLALVHSLVNEGVFTAAEYGQICTILNKKYGLPTGSIFAEIA